MRNNSTISNLYSCLYSLSSIFSSFSTYIKHQIALLLQKLYQYSLPILVVISVLIYAHTLFHDFVYDDKIVLVENEHIKNGAEGLKKIWTTNYLNGYQNFNDALYRPLSLTVFNFVYSLSGDRALPFHLINILFYGLLIGVVYKLFDTLFPDKQIHLFFGVLLFAVHPVHTEVVANIKSLDEILALLLGVCACWFSIRFKDHLYGFILMLLAYTLALFAKESAISFVIIIPVLYYFSDKEVRRKRLLMLIGSLSVITITWYALHQNIIANMPREVDEGLFGDISNSIVGIENPINRFITGLWLLTKYFLKLIFPWPLYGDYSFNSIPTVQFMSIRFFATLLFLGTSIWLFVKGVMNRKPTALAVLLFFTAIIPTSNLLMYIGTTFAERLVFTASMGLIPLVVSLSAIGKKPIKVGLMVVAGVFALLSIYRAQEWKTNLTLYEADAKRNPQSFRTHYNYATVLMETIPLESKNKEEENRLRKSIAEFNDALAIRPDFADALLNLGNAYKRLGEFDKALEFYDRLIAADPQYAKAYFNKGIIWYQLKQYKKAKTSLLKYTEIGYGNLPSAWYWAGVSSGYLNEFPQAIEYLKKSVDLDSSKWEVWSFLGMAYGNTEDWEKAVEAFQKAFSIHPSNEIKSNLEMAEAKMANLEN